MVGSLTISLGSWGEFGSASSVPKAQKMLRYMALGCFFSKPPKVGNLIKDK